MKHFNFTNKKSNYLLLAIISFLIIVSAIFINNYSNQTVSKSGFYFNTYINISIYDKPKKDGEFLIDKCFDICNEYENLYSKTIPTSDIYKINHSNKKPVKVDNKTIDIIKKSIDYAKVSNGEIDPSIGTLTSLWNILDDDFILPSDDDIKTALSTVNYNNIIINDQNNTITLSDENSMIDLGFIAKGYIADELKEYLINNNVQSAIINLGGNILCIGTKPDKSDFTIGINDPKNPYSNSLTSIKINDLSVVSSGNYERFKDINGTRYHHIISLKNGYPASSDLSQVTIISSSSTDGDFLSTLCYILGHDKAITFLENNYPDVTAIFVDSDGNIIK